ncbi:uncharacterized protein LOC131224651 [Magnolia sinica]|uniref:uncharacterized protein LOC131224651 n=1 Tax=Magnolia sinica TaxID=86752 RepID=UPI00265ACED0|nr:uncharacterized protein LOC131224651 [Magnolia sinica]
MAAAMQQQQDVFMRQQRDMHALRWNLWGTEIAGKHPEKDIVEAKFLEKYFPWSCRNEKIAQFLKLEQGSLTVAQYKARFNELSQYVPKALEDAEYKLQKFKEGLRQGIQSRLCAWDFEDFTKLVDKAIRVENNFERALRTRSSAREALVRPRQAPPAPFARRARVMLAGAPPMPPVKGCEYCHKIVHSARSCLKKMRDEGIAPLASHPQTGLVAARPALRPQMQRSGPLVHQRAPTRVFAVATTDTEEDLHQTIHGTAHIHGTLVFLLFDSGATISFMDSTIANRLGLNITRIHAPLVVASPMGKFLETDKICKDCPLTLAHHEVAVDLILMPMKQFDIMLRMDWLSQVRAVMDCHNKMVTITVLGQASFTVKGKIFQEILGLPPRRAVDFCINLKPGTAPISLPPFRMPPCEMEELRKQIDELMT